MVSCIIISFYFIYKIIEIVIIIEIKCTINLMCLNQPEIIPPFPLPTPCFAEKLSSTKPVPDAKKDGDGSVLICRWFSLAYFFI